jgi:AraC-like DNA-binding protein/quercetin dioxygenase-like cupin family protein
VRARIEKILLPSQASFVAHVVRMPRFPFMWHFHPEYELTCIVKGRGRRFVGDAISAYGPGDLVLLGPGLAHTWASDGGGGQEAVVLQFPQGFPGKEFLELPEALELGRLLKRSGQGLEFSGAGAREAARRLQLLVGMKGLERLLAALDCLRLLSGLKARALSSPGFSPALRTGDQERIERVCDYLLGHATEAVSLPQAAKLANLSVPAFGRLFRKATGRSLVSYLCELRVGIACRLLQESSKSVMEICHESGFNNLAHFNRIFKRLRNMSPRAFRGAMKPYL